MWNPEQEAARLGVAIHHAPIPDMGRYYRDRHLIVLREDLDPLTRRCVLGHEIAHAHYLDTCGDPRTEQRAWRWAANRLITLDDLVQCALDHPENPEQWCHTLQVTPLILRTWLSQRSNYERADQRIRAAA